MASRKLLGFWLLLRTSRLEPRRHPDKARLPELGLQGVEPGTATLLCLQTSLENFPIWTEVWNQWGIFRQVMFDYWKAFACWEKNFRHVHLRCCAVFPVQDIQWVRATTYWNPQDYRSLHITVSQNYSGWCSFFRFHYGFERFSHF